MSANDQVRTVLVVDDDHGLSRLIEKALRRERFAVATATSGKEAIAWLGKNRADLMLLDLKLHDIEGKELINHLADINRSLPFIVITGQGDERVAVDMMKRGALDYLVKDVDFLQFIPGVVWRALNQLDSAKRLAETEAALRESEARFRLTADHAPVLIWMSGTNRLCTWFNRPWLEFTGRSLEQELGNGWTQGVHPDDLPRCLDTYVKAFDDRKRFALEYRLRRHDGEWRWVYDSGIPLRGPTGRFSGYIGSCIDITERKRLEKEVLAISEREQRRIGQDLHDSLGQQLTAIELMCQALKADPEALANRQELESHLDRVCRCIRQVIGQTRALAQGLAPFKVDAVGLESALAELARTTSAPGGRVTCFFEYPAPVALTDNEAATHLYRIAQEAVNNAVKHSRATKVTIHLSQQNGALRLLVSDNGNGFPRTKTASQGMGLRVMNHRASVIGAELEVKSRPGKGVSVLCMLPASKQ